MIIRVNRWIFDWNKEYLIASEKVGGSKWNDESGWRVTFW